MPNVPTFSTARLILRELLESDAPAYTKHFVNYAVIRNLASSVPWPYPENGVINYLRSEIIPYQGKEKWVWAITLKENPQELIGAIELLRQATPANRGFWLGENFWGHGYMTEAVEPITDYAFETLNFPKLIFANAVNNQRSARVKEKTGAQLVRRESARYVDPLITERCIYELTKAQWYAFKDSK